MAHPVSLPRGAVGLGFRVEVAADLLRDPGAADFVEVVAEACFSSPASRREAAALSRVWPVVPHGVKLSLGSAEGIDVDRARRLGDLARELGAPAITEHVAFVRAGGREIGHLTQLPFTREAVRAVARNVATARRCFPDVPLLLENAAWTFRWPGDEIAEGDFYGEIAEATGCDLLLDLGNLYANARNGGADPGALLDGYPLDRVGMIHIAGGFEEDDFYFDTHANAVPEGVFALLTRVTGKVGSVPVVLERDDDFPAFGELAAEVDRARRIVAEAGEGAGHERPGRGQRGIAEKSSPSGMAEAQARVAELLTVLEEPPAGEMKAFGERAMARSREVLKRKRVDDALPLLVSLQPHREAVKEMARACLSGTPRAPVLAGVTDAMRIARAAAETTALGAPARLDLLLLRARFAGSIEGGLRARVGPFVGRERVAGGKVVWAVKGVGGGADVRVFETR